MRAALTIIATFTLFSAFGEEYLSLSEATTLALENNPAIKAADYRIRAAARNRQAAMGLYFPQISINSGWIHAQRDVQIDFNPLKEVVKEFDIAPLLGLDWRYTIQRGSFGFIEADITQPIFTGGKIIAANRAAQISERATLIEYNSEINKITSEVIERYFGVVLATNSVKIRKLALHSIEQHLADVTTLFDNGMATKADMLYIQYALQEAQQELSAAVSNLSFAQRALNTTVGSNGTISTTSPIFTIPAINELNYFIDKALDNNPQLAYIASQQELARQNISIKRADFFPEIAAIGGGALTRNVTDILPRWAVGIGLKFTLFNGAQREYNYLAAKELYNQTEEIGRSANQNIRLLIEELYNTTISHLNRAIALKSSILYAEEYLSNRKQAFAEHIATSTDVIDATILLATSQIRELEAAYNFDISLSRLLEATGDSNAFFDYSESINSKKIEYEIY